MGWKLVFLSFKSATLSIFSRIWKDEAANGHKFKSIFDISSKSGDGNIRKDESDAMNHSAPEIDIARTVSVGWLRNYLFYPDYIPYNRVIAQY